MLLIGILALIATVSGQDYSEESSERNSTDVNDRNSTNNCSSAFSDEYKGNCYKVSAAELTPQLAQKSCRDLGGELVKLPDTNFGGRKAFAKFIENENGQCLILYNV